MPIATSTFVTTASARCFQSHPSCCRLCHYCFPRSRLCRSQVVASRRCRTCSCRRPPDIAFPSRPLPHASTATTIADHPSRSGCFVPCVLLYHHSRLHFASLLTAPALTIVFFMEENNGAPTALSFGLLCLFPCAKNCSHNPHRPQLWPSPSAPISRQQLTLLAANLAAATTISSSPAPAVVATFSAESSPSSPAAPLLTALAAALVVVAKTAAPLCCSAGDHGLCTGGLSRHCCNLDQSLFRYPATAYAPSFLMCMPCVRPPLPAMPTPSFSVRLTWSSKSIAVRPS
ncbi:hypothetical protein BHM03_00038183 [Ensete ventricosum]|nr:hypothetical protein BHM03_00038183 [Ensete ventricosum]